MKLDYANEVLDNVNLQIMDILGKDSTTPFVEIAKQIGISDATVHVRVKKLRDERIINKFTISLNNNILGYDHLAFAGINIRPGFADQVTEELSNLEEVLEIHEMHNTFDLFLKIKCCCCILNPSGIYEMPMSCSSRSKLSSSSLSVLGVLIMIATQ